MSELIPKKVKPTLEELMNSLAIRYDLSIAPKDDRASKLGLVANLGSRESIRGVELTARPSLDAEPVANELPHRENLATELTTYTRNTP